MTGSSFSFSGLVHIQPPDVPARPLACLLMTRHGTRRRLRLRRRISGAQLVIRTVGSNVEEAFRELGVYFGRAFMGARPANLPVMQSSMFELVINQQTATMLGREGRVKRRQFICSSIAAEDCQLVVD